MDSRYFELEHPDFKSQQFEPVESLLWWQEKGLSYTASGYGRKIPTRWKIKVTNRLYRVYCYIHSNVGFLYIIKNRQEIAVEQYWR